MKRFALICSFVLSTLVVSAQLNVEATIDMGRSSLYYDDYVTAIARFSDVILLRPNQPDSYYYRAYAKFSLEDYRGAHEDLERAIRLQPFRTEFYQLRGLCQINLADYAAAIADYSYVLQHEPRDINSRYNRALCYLEQKDFVAAETDLHCILRQNPRHIRARLVIAQSQLEQHDTLSGLQVIDTLLTFNPYQHEALAFRARYSLLHHEYQLADSLLCLAIQHGGLSADNLITRAQARHGLSRYNDALADYDLAIQQQPRHYVAHYNRGLLRALLGADNEAIEDFDFVLGLEPSNTLALYNRALLRERTGLYEGAEQDFTKLIESYPDFIHGYAARARCRRHQGKTRLALSDESTMQRLQLDIAFGQNRKRTNTPVERNSPHELDSYDELMELEQDTTHRYVSQVAGRVQNRRIDHQPLPLMPEDDIRALLAESPSHPGALAQKHYNEACLQAEMGNTQLAIQTYTRAIALDPRLGQAYYNRALLYLSVGESRQASADLSKAGELGIYQAYNLLKISK